MQGACPCRFSAKCPEIFEIGLGLRQQFVGREHPEATASLVLAVQRYHTVVLNLLESFHESREVGLAVGEREVLGFVRPLPMLVAIPCDPMKIFNANE